MSKSIKNCFYKKLTFESLLRSHDRAKKIRLIDMNYLDLVLILRLI